MVPDLVTYNDSSGSVTFINPTLYNMLELLTRSDARRKLTDKCLATAIAVRGYFRASVRIYTIHSYTHRLSYRQSKQTHVSIYGPETVSPNLNTCGTRGASVTDVGTSVSSTSFSESPERATFMSTSSTSCSPP